MPLIHHVFRTLLMIQIFTISNDFSRAPSENQFPLRLGHFTFSHLIIELSQLLNWRRGERTPPPPRFAPFNFKYRATLAMTKLINEIEK